MVLNGIDRIGQYDAVLKGKRLGLITSISGVNNSLYSSIDILSEKYTLAALYSPEHGVRGNVAAGGIHIKTRILELWCIVFTAAIPNGLQTKC